MARPESLPIEQYKGLREVQKDFQAKIKAGGSLVAEVLRSPSERVDNQIQELVLREDMRTYFTSIVLTIVEVVPALEALKNAIDAGVIEPTMLEEEREKILSNIPNAHLAIDFANTFVEDKKERARFLWPLQKVGLAEEVVTPKVKEPTPKETPEKEAPEEKPKRRSITVQLLPDYKVKVREERRRSEEYSAKTRIMRGQPDYSEARIKALVFVIKHQGERLKPNEIYRAAFGEKELVSGSEFRNISSFLLGLTYRGKPLISSNELAGRARLYEVSEDIEVALIDQTVGKKAEEEVRVKPEHEYFFPGGLRVTGTRALVMQTLEDAYLMGTQFTYGDIALSIHGEDTKVIRKQVSTTVSQLRPLAREKMSMDIECTGTFGGIPERGNVFLKPIEREDPLERLALTVDEAALFVSFLESRREEFEKKGVPMPPSDLLSQLRERLVAVVEKKKTREELGEITLGALEKVQQIVQIGLLPAYVERVGDDTLSRKLLEHFVNLGEDRLQVMDDLVDASLEQYINSLESGDLSQEETSSLVEVSREVSLLEDQFPTIRQVAKDAIARIASSTLPELSNDRQIVSVFRGFRLNADIERLVDRYRITITEFNGNNRPLYSYKDVVKLACLRPLDKKATLTPTQLTDLEAVIQEEFEAAARNDQKLAERFGL
ncbi:hypothetical protein HYT33_03315 [Candidatus Roizmanbacteria bacterium]|nr:hypothetical protein [Candidatus Roizmanbacteria bacterium]